MFIKIDKTELEEIIDEMEDALCRWEAEDYDEYDLVSEITDWKERLEKRIRSKKCSPKPK